MTVTLPVNLAELAAEWDRRVFLERPAQLDDLDVDQRIVTASIGAARLGRSTRTIQRWAATGRLRAVACLVEGRAELYSESDIRRAERDARRAKRDTQFQASA